MNLSTTFKIIRDVFPIVKDAKYHTSPRDFSRDGVLSPELVSLLILFMVADAGKRGYEQTMIMFWDEARSHGLDLPQRDPVSAASFGEARQKLAPAVFLAMTKIIYESMCGRYQDATRWMGRRVLAVDGSKINLNRAPQLARAFGVPDGAHNPQALASVLFDVVTKTPVSWCLDRFDSCERTHLLELLPHASPGDVVVVDRGYPSHEVLQALFESDLDFLVRLPAKCTFKCLDSFRDEGNVDSWVPITPPDKRTFPLVVRLVRTRAPDGEESFFVTNLREAEFDREKLGELYHLRWDVEEFYKLVKSDFIGQGQFRSKSASGVKQEFGAQMMFLAISKFLSFAAAEEEGCEPGEIQQKGAVLAWAAYLTRCVLIQDTIALEDTLTLLIQRIGRGRYRKRPGRTFLRRSFKPTPKWGAQGRRGA